MLFKGIIAGHGLHGGTLVMAPGQFAHFTINHPPHERAISPKDVQRLGIPQLAPGLVEPQPAPIPTKPADMDHGQPQGPEGRTQPVVHHPAHPAKP